MDTQQLNNAMWILITLIGVGGSIFLVYASTGNFIATGNAAVAAFIAFGVGQKFNGKDGFRQSTGGAG